MVGNIQDSMKEKALILTGMPYDILLNPFANETKGGVYLKEIGQGIVYVSDPAFSSLKDFTAYRTPRLIFLGGENPLVCHSPKYVKVEKLTPDDIDGVLVPKTKNRTVNEFGVHNLEKDPLLQRELKTEPADFFPHIETRVRFSDREIELKQGKHANTLHIIEPDSGKTIRELTTYSPYFWGVFRSEDYLFIISNDFYDWDCGIERVNLSIDASFDELPIEGDQLVKAANVQLSYHIVTGAVVDRDRLEGIMRNYELDENFEKRKGRVKNGL